MSRALGVQDLLLQGRVGDKFESGVFFVQFVKSGGDFFFVTFGLGFYGGIHNGVGKFDFGKGNRETGIRQSVTGVRVFEFY